MNTTTLIWRNYLADPPPYNGIHLLAERCAETDKDGRLLVVEADRGDDGKWTMCDGECEIEESKIVLWSDMPWPSIHGESKAPAFSAPELWQAIVRGGFDLSPCQTCGKPVVCLPDGMSNICEGCHR